MSDLIDREYAIKKFCEYGTYLERHGVPIITLCDAKQRAVDLIESLPSAQPTYTDEEIQKMQDLESAEIEKAYQLGYEEGKKERKTGKWITVNGRLGDEVECDKCKSVFWYWMGTYRYCPSCGSDNMRGESDE